MKKSDIKFYLFLTSDFLFQKKIMKIKVLIKTAILYLLIISYSCKEADDIAPFITIEGNEIVDHVLNTEYIDAGATATDETDGNVTANIYVENNVNENMVGEYTVTYKVVDKAGNEAVPSERIVFVYNTSEGYIGNYSISENQVYPLDGSFQYDIMLSIDSLINNRIGFSSFAGDFGKEVYADITDSVIVIPFQVIEDSLNVIALQGSGKINDSIISIEYTQKEDTVTSLWNAELIKFQ